MWHRALTLTVLMLSAAGTAGAQWQVGAGIAIQSFGRWVVSPPDRLGGGPDGRPTTTWPLIVEVQHGGAGGRVGIAVSRSRPGLEIFDTELRIALRPAFEVIGIVPQVSIPVVQLEHGGAVRAGIGAPLERWTFPGSADPPRWRVGALAMLSAELPISTRMAGRVSVSAGTLLSHPLKATDALEDYLPTHTWRRALGVGMMWRL